MSLEDSSPGTRSTNASLACVLLELWIGFLQIDKRLEFVLVVALSMLPDKA